jgi:hypothetical protein
MLILFLRHSTFSASIEIIAEPPIVLETFVDR